MIRDVMYRLSIMGGDVVGGIPVTVSWVHVDVVGGISVHRTVGIVRGIPAPVHLFPADVARGGPISVYLFHVGVVRSSPISTSSPLLAAPWVIWYS